jgi:ABC-type hemin transport system ATPase subunit
VRWVKVRVYLAHALAQVWEGNGATQAHRLLLDEPAEALDLQQQHRMMQLVRT